MHKVIATACLLLVGPTSLAAQASEESAIRAVRAASNAAIAGRDLGTLRTTVVDDVNVSSSTGLVFAGADAMMSRFKSSFDDPEFVTYVRTPETVRIGETGDVAAEQGSWVGTWKMADGTMRVRGTFMAQWRKHDGVWRIRSEVFVGLSCEGSAACPPRG